MTDKQYFSEKQQKEYITSTQIKTYLECPLKFQATINGVFKEEPNEAMILGSYIEKALTGGLDDFIEENKDIIYKKKGEGKLIGFVRADELVEELKKDKELMKLLKGKNQEVYFGEIRGHKVMCKVDSLLADKLVDLKYMADFNGRFDSNESRFKEWWELYRYDLQMALYHTILRQNGIIVPPYIVAITKEQPADKGLFEFSNATLNKQKELINDVIDEIVVAKNPKAKVRGCGKCNYCKSLKTFGNIKKEVL
jgi:hypothetical protein